MLLERLSAYGARDTLADLPEDVMHHAKRAVLDWLSALYPGTRVSPCRELLAAHAAELGYGASGRAFLNAVVAGYEISTRIGAAVQPAHSRYFHTTGTVGCLGAAAAAAALAAPGKASAMLHALATSATLASGTRALMRRITVVEDPALTAGFPSMRAARVAVVTDDGVAHEHFSPYRKGDPEAPLSDAELNDKFDELAGPVLGTARSIQLRQAVWALESMNVRDLALATDLRRA